MLECFVKDICTPIADQYISYAKNNFDHVSHLQLAYNNPDCCNLQIDILVGTDYYWSIISNNVIRGASGPVAIQSKVGYILSGPLQTAS